MNTMKISTGVLKFTFTDEDDRVFSSFRMNPADPNVAYRCQEVAAYFANLKGEKYSTLDEIVAYDKQLTEKISYILGYDAKQEIFGEVSATTVLPSGELFAIVVLDAIADAAKPEIEKRKAAMAKAAAKYTDKYENSVTDE